MFRRIIRKTKIRRIIRKMIPNTPTKEDCPSTESAFPYGIAQDASNLHLFAVVQTGSLSGLTSTLTTEEVGKMASYTYGNEGNTSTMVFTSDHAATKFATEMARENPHCRIGVYHQVLGAADWRKIGVIDSVFSTDRHRADNRDRFNGMYRKLSQIHGVLERLVRPELKGLADALDKAHVDIVNLETHSDARDTLLNRRIDGLELMLRAVLASQNPDLFAKDTEDLIDRLREEANLSKDADRDEVESTEPPEVA